MSLTKLGCTRKKLRKNLEESRYCRIRELVKNPLRLSLLCQIFYVNKNAELPETKAGLYEQFVRYFYEWKTSKLVPDLLQQVGLQNKLHEALGRLALAGLDGLDRFRLRQSVVYREMQDDSLVELAMETGWLNQVDLDSGNDEPVYAFFHPTFQEYFVALAINNQSDLCSRSSSPQWEETVLLWLGRKGSTSFEQQKENLLEDFRNDYSKLHLATRGITEYRSYLFDDEVIKEAIEYGFSIDGFNEEAGEHVRSALLQTNNKLAVKHLIRRVIFDENGKIENDPEGYPFNEVVRENGRKEITGTTLDGEKIEDYIWNYRWTEAVIVLAKIGIGQTEVVTALRGLTIRCQSIYESFPQAMIEALYLVSKQDQQIMIERT